MTLLEILLVVAVACLALYLVYVLRTGRRGTRAEEMTRLRQEVRETIAANQTAFSGQIQQVGELLKHQLDPLTNLVPHTPGKVTQRKTQEMSLSLSRTGVSAVVF